MFTELLALICIMMGSPYLFMPSNMLLLEMAIIAIPSFFLSLQPNKERVQGKFITHVLSGAVSGAALMIICVMAMYLTKTINPALFEKNNTAMCMIALTFSGFVMVFRLCQPMNVYRAVLCAGVFAICVTMLAVPFIAKNLLYSGWYELNWEYGQILTIVVVIEAAFPVSGWLIELARILFPSIDKRRRTTAQKNN